MTEARCLAHRKNSRTRVFAPSLRMRRQLLSSQNRLDA